MGLKATSSTSFLLLFKIIFLTLSIITGIVITIKKGNNANKAKPNLVLAIILLLIIIPLFYTATITAIATNPNMCFLHIEAKQDSFMFPKGITDNCIRTVALNTNNPEYCSLIRHNEPPNSIRDSCYHNIAMRMNNLTICEGITEENRKERCIRYISGETQEHQDNGFIEGEELEIDYIE